MAETRAKETTANAEVDELRPILITDNETGEKYVLEFNAESVAFAEERKFQIGDVDDYPVTGVRDLFYYAFRMHHKMLPKDKILNIYELTKPLPRGVIKRLVDFYLRPMKELVVPEGEERKNERMTVEL